MAASTEKPAFGSDMGLVLRTAVLSRRFGDPVKFWAALSEGQEMMKIIQPLVEHMGVLQSLGYKLRTERPFTPDVGIQLLELNELFGELDEILGWEKPAEEYLTTGIPCPDFYKSAESQRKLAEVEKALRVPKGDTLGVETHFLRAITRLLRVQCMHPEELLGYLVVDKGEVVRVGADKLERMVLYRKFDDATRRRSIINLFFPHARDVNKFRS